jgi:hypothetical protein
MSRQPRSLPWAALVVTGVLLPFAPVLVGARTLAQHDTDRFFAPFRVLVEAALRSGRLPLWNPYEAGGKPLFAEGVHSVLHPVSLAAAFLAPGRVDVLILGYLVLAALGAFALARTLGASPPAAAGAGLAFALTGFTVSMAGNLVFLAGASSLPWVLAAARAAGAGWRLGPAATALATACAFFSGDAQVALLGLVLGAALAAEAGGPRGLGRALAGFGPGLLLAGVQLAATRELLPLTARSLDLSAEELTRWALPPARLLEWIVPGLFRGPLEVVPRASSGRMLEFPFTESVYLGAPLLVAAALGARRSGRRAALLLALAAGVLLWLALGHHLGARQLLDVVPLWNKFRYAEKLVGPLALVLAMLAALGADAFGAGRLGARWTGALAGAALAVAATLLALRLAPGTTGALAAGLLGDEGGFYRATLAAGLPHALVGLAAALAADRLGRPAARTGALALLMALASAAAVRSGAALGDPAARAVPPMRLEAAAPGPRLFQASPGPYPDSPGRACTDVYAEHFAALRTPSTNVGARVDALDAYCAFRPLRYTAIREELGGGAARWLRRFGLTHLVVPVPSEPEDRPIVELATEGGRLVERDARRGREVWAVPHRPWAFFAGGAEASAGPREAFLRLLDLMARGDDGTVVVEAPAAPPTAPGQVLAVERAAERVVVEAEASGPALLVVQDAWWPGWRATIDGQPAEVLAADALVRAVRWPAGRHRLELIYDPAGVRLGRWLSAAGAALVLLLLGLALRGGPSREGVRPA